MQQALIKASVLAAQNLDHENWSPENPLCASKLCSFGGRTRLWTPPLIRSSDPYRLDSFWWYNARKRSHRYEVTTPQKRVVDWIGFGRGHLHFVVCCEMCSEDVKMALTIGQLAVGHGPPLPKLQVLMGVDELVLPTGLPDDSESDNHFPGSGSGDTLSDD